MSTRLQRITEARLVAMIEEATVDCNGEEEELTGLFTLLEDNLALPFETTVLGVGVTVVDVDLTERGDLVAICHRDGVRQTLPLLDLPLPEPPPVGAEWIEAHRRWLP